MYYMKINPFEPDRPAKPSIFAGRRYEIEQLKRALYRTYKGKAQNILLEGERGIGKTSLANYVDYLANAAPTIFKEPEIRFLTVFTSLGTCRSVDEVCVNILDEVNKKIKEVSNVYDLFMGIIEKIDGISIGWFGLQLKNPDLESSVIAPKFAFMLEELWEKIKSTYKAMLIILDETEVVAKLPGFAPFLKSLIEKLSYDGYEQIMFLVSASPEARVSLDNAHPSFSRGLTPVRISPLDKEETRELVENVLRTGVPPLKASDVFIDKIHYWSDGIPSFIHELGRAAFDVNTDDILDEVDLALGVVGTDEVKGSLATLEDKHFRARYTQRILSNTYRDILHVIASFNKDVVTYTDIKKNFRGNPNALGSYLGNMVKRGVLERIEGKQGKYRLPDKMFKLFLRLPRQRSRVKRYNISEERR